MAMTAHEPPRHLRNFCYPRLFRLAFRALSMSARTMGQRTCLAFRRRGAGSGMRGAGSGVRECVTERLGSDPRKGSARGLTPEGLLHNRTARPDRSEPPGEK